MMPSLNEPIVEAAALTWLGERGYAIIGQAPRFSAGRSSDLTASPFNLKEALT